MLPWRDQNRLVVLEEELVRAAQRAEGAGPAGPALERLSEAYNSLAMRLVDAGQFPGAHELLRKAEMLTEEASPSAGWAPAEARRRLHAVTLNNLGCYFKRRGKLHAALGYLEEALALEEGNWEAAGPGLGEVGRLENPAGTLLNICATLGALGRHREAAEFAGRALHMGLEELGAVEGSTTGGDDVGAGLREERALARAVARGGEWPGGEAAVATVAMAYHNLATQQEALGEADAALRSYGRAVQAVKLCRGGLGAGVGHSVQRAHRNFARHYREAQRRAGREAEGGRTAGRKGPGGGGRPHSAAPRVGGDVRPGRTPEQRRKLPLAQRPQPQFPASTGAGPGSTRGCKEPPLRPSSAKQNRTAEIYLCRPMPGKNGVPDRHREAFSGRSNRPGSAPPRSLLKRPEFQL